ncbi:MAG: hypothetical protein JWN14_2469 [Chthonomonadales bacterium]|nr:hypothetical protein [Chthonomonadales bacterium]
MACQSTIEIRKGMTVPLFGSLSASSGTLTITGGTFSLYDNTSGTAVVNGAPLTGQDAAAAVVRCWYTLTTATLPAGWYSGLFTVQATATRDSIARTEMIELLVHILPVVEVVATYDPLTPSGQTRYLAGDTNMGRPIWTDAEVTAALAAMSQIARLAASWLLDGAASDAARMTIIAGTDSEKTDLSKLAEALRTQAQYLRGTAIVSPVVVGGPSLDLGLESEHECGFGFPSGRR